MGTISKYNYLTKLGFEYGVNSGARGETGFTKTVSHGANERLWITINIKKRKAYFYNEWWDGGKLWSYSLDIPELILDNKTDFINWINEAY